MIDTKRMELLVSTAASMGLNPQIVTNYGLVSIDINGQPHYLFHLSSNPNDQLASWVSQNKHATRIVLEKHNLPNIPFSRPESLAEAKEFLATQGPVIVKPTKGQKSQNIHLVHNEAELEQLNLSGCILEKFIKGQEVRFLVVDSNVTAVHHKVYAGDINDPKTVKRVSLERESWDNHLASIAVSVAKALGLVFTAVDFIVTADGDAYILEVNSAPGLARFQEPDEGPAIDIMRLYLERIVKNYSAKQ